ncbi:hypothetical protein PAECIP111891_03187 [Paenibacillus allorhizoplanae]|uniref:Shedu protein SduA C-terminal domain-containing protein n=1 Tax=Paenibacillus allorhizoplanae TaxID=2905648 RepID=A0ABM9CD26_9BACL|nr:Shedu anti-phage system protein SduA domain-containing protein [Paenibacillus allorhizoplanae]CAH1208273.1 hypothetical protein PAECIP111891_03187 [Paenibacillus allorhizoplanae]
MDEIITELMSTLRDKYLSQIWFALEHNKELKRSFPAFLLNPDNICIYLGKNHLAIEYVGPYKKEIVDGWEINFTINDYSESENLIEEIVGLKFNGTGIPVPIIDEMDDLFVATDEATTILVDNNWNFLAQEMMFCLNTNGLILAGEKQMRIRNSYFYAKSGDGLKVRNIQWMDIFPISRKDVDEDHEEIGVHLWSNITSLALRDSRYTIPEKFDFQFDKLTILNRFIELFNSENVSETDITRFLSQPEHHFILNMAFFGQYVSDEIECAWVGEPDRSAIRPDFLITASNGFADIVEFKLPDLKSNSAVVGRNNRETFSAELHSYIAQTRVYSEYFNDPRNREFVKNTFGIQVYLPRRFLVVGRRLMFPPELWRAIENDYSNITIRTYDDIVATVMGFLAR